MQLHRTSGSTPVRTPATTRRAGGLVRRSAVGIAGRAKEKPVATAEDENSRSGSDCLAFPPRWNPFVDSLLSGFAWVGSFHRCGGLRRQCRNPDCVGSCNLMVVLEHVSSGRSTGSGRSVRRESLRMDDFDHSSGRCFESESTIGPMIGVLRAETLPLLETPFSSIPLSSRRRPGVGGGSVARLVMTRGYAQNSPTETRQKIRLINLILLSP